MSLYWALDPKQSIISLSGPYTEQNARFNEVMTSKNIREISYKDYRKKSSKEPIELLDDNDIKSTSSTSSEEQHIVQFLPSNKQEKKSHITPSTHQLNSMESNYSTKKSLELDSVRFVESLKKKMENERDKQPVQSNLYKYPSYEPDEYISNQFNDVPSQQAIYDPYPPSTYDSHNADCYFDYFNAFESDGYYDASTTMSYFDSGTSHYAYTNMSPHHSITPHGSTPHGSTPREQYSGLVNVTPRNSSMPPPTSANNTPRSYNNNGPGQHLPASSSTTFSFEYCENLAKKYDSVGTFQSNHPELFNLVKELGWLHQICSHMITGKRTSQSQSSSNEPPNKRLITTESSTQPISMRGLDFKTCLQDASKYFTLMQYRTHNFPSFYFAKRNGWISKLSNHFVDNTDVDDSFNPELTSDFASLLLKFKCYKESLKYLNRRDFFQHSDIAYLCVLHNKWSDEIFAHMAQGYWNYERCRVEALKYSSYKDFQENSRGAYQAALHFNILAAICKHMEIIYNLKQSELRSLSISSRNMEESEDSIMGNVSTPRNTFTKEECFKLASKCRNKTEFIKTNFKVYKIAAKNGWFDEICDSLYSKSKQRQAFPLPTESVNEYDTVAHVEHPVQQQVMPTNTPPERVPMKFENCKLEASKYDSIDSFKTMNYNAYISAKEGGFLNAICNHMQKNTTKQPSVTPLPVNNNQGQLSNQPSAQSAKILEFVRNKVYNQAQKFQSRATFKKYCEDSYNVALKAGWLDEFCAHMTT